MHEDFHLGGCVVVHLAYLYLALLGRFQYRFDKCCRSLSIGNLGDGQRLVVHLVDAGTHAHRSATLTVIVAGHVDEATRLEVGVEHKVLPLEAADGRVAQLVKVMRQNLR